MKKILQLRGPWEAGKGGDMFKELTGDEAIMNFLKIYPFPCLAESNWSVTEPKIWGFALTVGQNIGYF